MATPSEIPLRQISLSQWSAAEIERVLEERPLFLHLKRQRSRPSTDQKRIIILVHGVNSGAATWMTFLTHAFPKPELESFDFGLFNYQTSLVSRLNPFQRLPNPEDWANVIASFIRNTILTEERYDSYVLVGHSMGGLISKFVIQSFLEKDRAAAMRLHSLFLYGTPNHGSDRATAFASAFSPDLALLHAFGSPIRKLQSFWNASVSSVTDTPGKFTVHERALVSVKDYWVTPESGMGSLPDGFVLQLASSHAGLIRPNDQNDPRLAWFVGQLQAIQRLSECSLIAIRDGPAPEDFLGEDSGERLAKTIFQTRFVLDAGTANGIAKGDKFGLCHEAEDVKDATGRVVDRIPGSMNLIAAIDVKERVTYCKLDNFAWEAAISGIRRASKALETGSDELLDEQQFAGLVLALFGRRAIRIPRRESDAHEKLKDLYRQLLDEEETSAPRRKLLLELFAVSRDFLGSHPGSVLADAAAFQEAWATMELERYSEAEQLFERFCDNYPFSVSVPGARKWIEEVRLRLRLGESKNDPDQQLLLAEYLLKEESWNDLDELTHLGFEAFAARPTLLTRMSAGMRFLLTGEYVFHQVLGMSLEQPEAMSVLIGKYKSDPAFRNQTRANIEAAVPPDRARLLLDLLDSTELRKPADSTPDDETD